MSTTGLITYTQCALPVFEDLLSTHRENTLLRTLIFDLATWHAYAKLRLHTETTLNDFRTHTSTLGRSVCAFIKDVCSQYDTTELPHEMAARGRRVAALTKKSDIPRSQIRPTLRHKQLNLTTYKYHALGDYPDLIAQFSTTDNASTQTVRVFHAKQTKSCKFKLLTISIQGELEHKIIKRRFGRTNKRRHTSQLTSAEIRERVLRRVARRLAAQAKRSQIMGHRTRRRKRVQAESDEEDMVDSPDTARYDIASSTRNWENILEWVHTNHTDVATKVSILPTVTGAHTDIITHCFRTLFEDLRITF